MPAYIGLNYYGNQEIDADPAIRLCEGWLRNNEKHFIADHRASEKSRGLNPKSWPFETLITRGYALATACYGDIAPDDKDLYRNGVHQLFPPSTPGIGITAEALSQRAAKLPKVDLRWPPSPIGRNTAHSLQSGLMYGYAGLVEGIVARFVKELGPETRVIATGGLAEVAWAIGAFMTLLPSRRPRGRARPKAIPRSPSGR